jgi:ribose-phosphate pyrophosphokinase
MVVGFEDYAGQGSALAAALAVPFELARVHRFPDGESKVTLPAALPRQVVICRSLDHSNDKLVELMLAATTARELGAEHLTLVAPYLCYMRQDAAFAPGEAVSQRIVGQFLAGLFDRVVTVDPHLHRTPRLDLVVPAKQAIALSAAQAMGEFLRGRVADAFVLGPDAESEPWAAAVAGPGGLQFAACNKTRNGDRDVEIRLPQVPLGGRAVVLVDDVASTGHTLATAAKLCLQQRAASVDVLVTHALFVGDAVADLRRAGVRDIWSTDSVTHASNVLPLASMIANALLC